MAHYCFRHKLTDAWNQPISEIIIFIEGIANINGNGFEIPGDLYYKIWDLTSNPKLYEEHDILFPPILDGTTHIIHFETKNKTKDIECFNLWYWNEEGAFDKLPDDVKSEDIEYTKIVLKTINSIQDELYKHNINFNILDDEE